MCRGLIPVVSCNFELDLDASFYRDLTSNTVTPSAFSHDRLPLLVLPYVSMCVNYISLMNETSLMNVTHHSAIFCNIDEMVLNHACVPCPAGSTNEAGDDASSVHDTACDGE